MEFYQCAKFYFLTLYSFWDTWVETEEEEEEQQQQQQDEE